MHYHINEELFLLWALNFCKAYNKNQPLAPKYSILWVFFVENPINLLVSFFRHLWVLLQNNRFNHCLLFKHLPLFLRSWALPSHLVQLLTHQQARVKLLPKRMNSLSILFCLKHIIFWQPHWNLALFCTTPHYESQAQEGLLPQISSKKLLVRIMATLFRYPHCSALIILLR